MPMPGTPPSSSSSAISASSGPSFSSDEELALRLQAEEEEAARVEQAQEEPSEAFPRGLRAQPEGLIAVLLPLSTFLLSSISSPLPPLDVRVVFSLFAW